MKEDTAKILTRRDFLKGAAAAAGLTLLGGAGSLLIQGCESKQTAPAQTGVTWPLPYKKLDPAKVAERAYNKYKEAGCGYGVFDAVIGTLADTYGEPYKNIPTKLASVYAGGMGVGSFCGALAGAASAVGLLCDAKTGKEVMSELVSWYKQFPFPKYQPAKLNLPTSVSNSELCEKSVGEWLKASGIAYDDPKRKERCGGLTADVASQLVEILNKKLVK